MLKACDPESSVTLVWRDDPAVDQDKSESGPDFLIAAQVDPTCWRERLVMQDGARATEWIMGVTPPAELNQAEDMEGLNARAWHVFLHSVREIKHANGLGTPDTIIRNGVTYVDPRWLTKTMGRGLRRCAKELGLVVYAWNALTEDDGKK